VQDCASVFLQSVRLQVTSCLWSHSWFQSARARRIEDKFETKCMTPWPVVVSMASDAHTNKRVPLRYQGWIVVPDSSSPQAQADEATTERCANIFLKSDLVTFQTNSTPASWITEANYRVPTNFGKDNVPHTQECRSMSEAQEAAQLLGGVNMPQEVVKSLLRGTDLMTEGGDYSVGFINLSPYDGAFEQCVLGLRELGWGPAMRTLSISNEMSVLHCSQTTVAVKLMQDPSPNPSLPHEDALCQGDLPLP